MLMAQVEGKLYSILLAEDDPDDQKIVLDAIEKAIPQAQVTVVDNGKEALQYLQASEALPDVLITDIQMPIMTGFEAIASIRSLPSLSKLPVVILSTSQEMDDIRKSQELNVALYISKPMFLKDWIMEMQRVGELIS
jgi:CheY-like chemotaxis protein